MTPVVNGQAVIVSGNGGPTTAFAVARRNNQWTTDMLWENIDSQLRFTNPRGRGQHAHRHVYAATRGSTTAWT